MKFYTFLLISSILAKTVEKRGRQEDYKLGTYLGGGSFGTVYVGTKINKFINKKYVLKVPNTIQYSYDNLRKAIHEEIAMLTPFTGRHKHPNVIKLSDRYHDLKTDLDVLVLEYMPGGDLFGWIESKQIVHKKLVDKKLQAAVTRIMWDMASGVNAVHNAQVCHRDIKLENFLLTTKTPDSILSRPPYAKISDFGLSQIKNRVRGICGTPGYLSPELWTAYSVNSLPANFDCYAADVWALGVSFYALEYGKLHVDLSQTFNGVAAQVQKGDFYFPSLSNAGTAQARLAQELIKKMLEIDPKKRITLTEVMQSPLFAKYHK